MIDPFVRLCSPAVERPPHPGGGEGDEAGRGSGASTPGASHGGAHPHPGEGSVRAGPSAAEEPLQHRAAVPHPREGQVTLELRG